MPSISDRLKEARELLGLSQQAIADKCGIAARSQRNYESGERSPDAVYLAAIAAVGVDIRYVVTGERDYTPPPSMSAEELTMLNYFRDASPEVRRAALGALLGASVITKGPNVIQNSAGEHAKHYGDIHGGIKIDKRKRG